MKTNITPWVLQAEYKLLSVFSGKELYFKLNFQAAYSTYNAPVNTM